MKVEGRDVLMVEREIVGGEERKKKEEEEDKYSGISLLPPSRPLPGVPVTRLKKKNSA
jgi:hypothetical protein